MFPFYLWHLENMFDEGGERLHLQDCQGGRLAARGTRKLIVTGRDGTEAELEHES